MSQRHKHLDKFSIEIYGKNYPSNFIGSPLEGSPGDSAETVLHELCHMVFLDIEIEKGSVGKLFDNIVWQLDNMPVWKSDLHEVRTLAAELLVAEKIGLDCEHQVLTLSHRNIRKNIESIIKPVKNETVVRLVELAMKTQKVKRVANKVAELYLES